MTISTSISLANKQQTPHKVNQLLLAKLGTWLVLALLITDFAYSAWNGINLQTRDRCVIYHFLPRWIFLLYEYLIELFLVVTAGAFAGSLAEKYFNRFRRILPKNQITAFLYASFIPVCSCSAIPLIETMKQRMSLKTIITFVMAAPLLNPYIIFLSFSVMGINYGLLRIAGAFIIAVTTGYVIEFAYNKMGNPEIGIYQSCNTGSCRIVAGNNIYLKTWKMIKKIAPYILIAGILGLAFEITGPVKLIDKFPMSGNLISLTLVTLIGIPIYFCNGADILFLAPLMQYTDLPLGTALSFSLTSTAICISSIIMLSRFLGRRLTAILSLNVIVLSFLFAMLINQF